MSFEDEKDLINNTDNSSDDDAISWDGILDTDEDGIVSIKKSSSGDIPTEVFTNDAEDEINIDTINIDDAIVNDIDDSSTQNVDTVDEDELKLIIGAEDGSDNVEYIDEQEELDTDALNDILMNNPDSSTDVSDQDVSADQNDSEEEILPRKEEIKKSNTPSPVLIALVFALLVSAGVYFVYSFFLNKDEEEVMPPRDQLPSNEQPVNNEDTSIDEVAENNQGDIPVINEDEASDLKPEEKTEEKKEVISIVPTGRINPFAPLQKYVYVPPKPPAPSIVYKTINNIDINSAQVPKPPKAYGELNEITDKLISITVTGIMYDTQKPSAIINYENNDYFVQIGDKLNNFKIVDISPSSVKIALGKNVYKAEVGERFKIPSEFYGNNPYYNGSRQYYSSEDEFDNRVQNTKKYTSKDDVKIYTK